MFNFFKKDKSLSIKSPITGEIVEITKVPDEVFAQKMVGDGVAINPTDGVIVSPCNGKVVQLFPTRHALGIESDDGVEILIHIGLDTVELKGEGFESFVEVGDRVKTGDKLLEVDFDLVEKKGKPIVSPVIITNPDFVEGISKNSGKVIAGEDEILKVELK
ncbi:PTS sugar transporter subunit IIA [Anaerosalibacter massiliensis]|uniref:PTS glucose transporter subunit IIA n=1 Tax=Anaerosalibacter massiliensis TaxID=1347392 RepID=A0A9X2MFX0_9FIRM|nr:PTS glucose transporter subunit IIA [Anaerosalibacter massiliensis]MCR2042924.1 PTS glucose transporter subunit IIA [Anaerosalibacter massiliensis]